MRHRNCFSFFDQENKGAFKHNCFGGYGYGKVFADKLITHEDHQSKGKWIKSSYNLDANRTRTYFTGVRSTKRITKDPKKGIALPTTNWKWQGFRAYMQCFSKPEYYSKRECIEKERYVGLHFSRPYQSAPT